MPPVSNNHAAATNSVSEGSLGSSDTPATTPQSELANNLAASQNVSMTLSSTDTDKKTASKTGQLQRDLEGVGNLSTATTNLNEAAGHARFGSTALAKPNEQDGVKNNSQRPSSASSVAPTLRATGLIDPEIKVDSDSDRHLASSLTSATVEKLNREFNQLKNINWNGLNTPSNPSDLREGNIVSIQQHVISAALNSEGSLVLTSAEHGDGLWVPYLGSVQGTYTDKLDDSISWVATGPFSGCHAGVFSNDTDIRFAHLVTPDAGFASPPIARTTSTSRTIPITA